MKTQLRDSIPTTGSFVSIPDAFPGADSGVVMAPKIELCVGRFRDAKHPLKFDHFMRPHHLLIDLEAVDPESFDSAKLVRDCEELLAIAKEQPDQLKRILAAFGRDIPHSRMLDAARLVEKLGLTEKKMAGKGGGLLWLVVIVAALALSSCKGCAHTKGATRQSNNSTPKS